LVRNSYLGEDRLDCAERFRSSAEFSELLALLGDCVRGGAILDLGAGTGIASYAFACSGARVVYALEPDPSDVVGRGAIRRVSAGRPIELLESHGEMIPLPSEEVDLVYARQVLHHVNDLPQVLSQCARVLKTGGVFFACREHVVSDDRELREFLEGHPVHRLAGGEGAYPLDTYIGAIRSAGLTLDRVLGPWDSLINAFPSVKTATELEKMPSALLKSRFGMAGGMLAHFPGVKRFTWGRIKRYRQPGRLYSFLATKA